MDKAPLTEHLGELRNRIIIILVVVSITFGVCFYYSEHIFRLLTLPLHYTLEFSLENPYVSLSAIKNSGLELVFLAPAEALWMHIKISFISAFIISSPLIFFEVWRFIAPGLLEKERKYALPFVFTTTFLFLLGALFCFIIVLPFAMNFLLTYKTENLKPMISVGKYIDFCLKFILSFGAIFELPVVTVFATRMGIVTPDVLAKNRKYAVLIAFIAAALLTPTPDAFNQTLMAVPIIILYEAGIWASRILDRKKKPGEEKED
ncbi:MAG TPA: twin-arginine translocase subunit TatC [Nitrospirae bacterium]|nr:sec-independent protein translocase protein TatC [bacterium BMS3Abin06]HDH12871.1 twin-arginine translocase subunit TatC [Nitrospirota bacterium]HDZ00479.1 twin-arginine translocase subunit TatC [Nitrospirota bacterium]